VDSATPIKVPSLSEAARANFDVRAFCAHYGLDGAKGGGAHMWREVWDQEVSKIYSEVLSKLHIFSCVCTWKAMVLMRL
jgi:large subunit ribosomal protein L35